MDAKPSLLRRPFFDSTPVLAFVLCLLLTVTSTSLAIFAARTENLARFDRAVGSFTDGLRNRMTIYTNALLNTRNLLLVKPDLTAGEFHAFIQQMRLKETYPGIQSIGYVVRAKPAAARKILRDIGRPRKLDDLDGSVAEHDIVKYFERLHESTSSVLGSDMGDSPARKDAMDRARDSGEAVATDRVVPMNTGAGPVVYAFLVFVPHYRSGMPLQTIEQRRRALLGFVYGGFRANLLFGRLTDDLRFRSQFAVEVFDGRGFTPEQLMFSEGTIAPEDVTYSREIEFQFANHVWSIRVNAPKNFIIPALRWAPYFVFLLGVVFSVAVALAIRRAQAYARRLQEDLIERQRTEKLLSEARRAADEANRAKSLFLANISHEIRTPLGVMIGFAEIAQAQEAKDERDASLQTVIRNGRELTRIIGDVLDVSKLEASTLKIENAPLEPRGMIEDLARIWRPQIEGKGLRFLCEIGKDVPAVIFGDETRLKQILTNLLSNATKFTAKGAVSLRVGTSREDGRSSLEFSVKDSGAGIPPEHRSRLFKPFSQGDSSITRKFGGSGLGLALSKQIARAMEGELSIKDSRPGEGSEFVLTIPYADAIGLKKPAAPEVSPRTMEGRRILVVDDSDDNRFIVSLLLKQSKAKVDEARDGEEAVAKAKAAGYDLILMDIQMPRMDGYTALRELKLNRVKTPVVALTAHALREEREQAMAAGFAAYLTKPIDRKALIEVSLGLIEGPPP